jgi:hypothetical protein
MIGSSLSWWLLIADHGEDVVPSGLALVGLARKPQTGCVPGFLARLLRTTYLIGTLDRLTTATGEYS